MPFNPYPHQSFAVDESWRILEAGRKPLIVLPTGGGKTAIAAMLAKECQGRVLIACCMIPLVMQFVEDLLMVGVEDQTIGILQGENSDSTAYLDKCRVVVAMSQTLQYPRGAEFLRRNKFGLSISDEKHLAHMDAADDLVNAPYQCAMTATPRREDGDESLYDYEWVQPVSLAQLLDENKLVDYDHYFYPEELEDEAFISPEYLFGQWLNILHGIPSLAFCRTTDDADKYAQYFGDRGYPCAVVDYETPEQEFVQARADFDAGLVHIIWSVTKIATGFNQPCAKGLMVCRRVRSVSLWVQIIGRILRRDGRGQNGILLDFFNNGRTLPDPRDIDDWKNVPSAQGKTCEHCGLKNSKKLYYCKNCGGCLASTAEIAAIAKEFQSGQKAKDYHLLTRPLERGDRLVRTVDQVSVAKAARYDAFWETGSDPVAAIVAQKQLLPGATPIVHSATLQGAIFGEVTPQALGAYVTYLQPHAAKRAKPDAWMKAEIRTEFGQPGMDLLRLIAA